MGRNREKQLSKSRDVQYPYTIKNTHTQDHPDILNIHHIYTMFQISAKADLDQTGSSIAGLGCVRL